MRKLISLLGVGLLLAMASVASAEDEAKEEGKEAGAEAVSATEDAAQEVKEETQAAAKEAGVKGTGTAKYGPAGCGLGSLIFEPDSGFTQIFAATTNGTSYTQTFGITSGTSNCDDDAGGEESAKAFVQTNRAALAKDIARGKGETIATLSELAACGDVQVVGKKLQKKFRTIFPSAKVTDQQVSDKVVEVLRQDRTLACSNLT
jgi:hypothetical protein